MMERKEILKQVNGCIAAVTGCESDYGEGCELKAECGLDSLSLVALIVGLEEGLGVTFEDADLDPERLLTVGDLVDLGADYA